MMMLTERRPILLANAHILDPSRDLKIDGDLLIADGVIREAKRGIGAAGVVRAASGSAPGRVGVGRSWATTFSIVRNNC